MGGNHSQKCKLLYTDFHFPQQNLFSYETTKIMNHQEKLISNSNWTSFL